MNSRYPLETSIRTSGLGRRIRSAIVRLTSSRRRELTREELALLREQQLVADRILDNARTSVYAARIF